MASWDTTSWSTTKEAKNERFEKRFSATLVKRAKKRTGLQVGKKKWVVDGSPKLGDQYEQYFVHRPKGEYKYRCSCQGHQGGEYRKLCSHSLYVMLALRGIVDIDIDLDEEDFKVTGTLDVEGDGLVYPPFLDLPAYVEGSGASVEEARIALDAEFCAAIEFRPLPSWVEYIRPSQHDALNQIQELYDEGKKVVFLDAPTGAGKTLLAEMVRRKVSPYRCVYTCTTLTLQDQFLEDFPYADVIKGRANYPTSNYINKFPTINAGQCTSVGEKTDCDLCISVGSCPYRIAKNVALKSNLAVANIAYLLTIANYQQQFNDRPFIIIDEADMLEQQLLSFVSLDISKQKMRALNMDPPKKKTVMVSWVEWVREEALPKVIERMTTIESIPGWIQDSQLKKENQQLAQMVAKLKSLGGWDAEANGWSQEEHGMDGWVYMDYDKGNVVFKPITVAEYAQKTLWKHSKRWLLMSATFVSVQQTAQDLGLEDDEWGVVTIGSDFPVENRPIYIQPVANMTWKEKDKSWPIMAKAIDKVADWHTGERILVHTVSYQLADFIKSRMRRNSKRVFTYRNARGRNNALKMWLASDDGIMLAPSFDRGVDLKDDRCRVIVVAKIPYPNLKDKQVNGRLYSKGGQSWYSMLTIRSVVQMTGRAMRSKDDTCEVYILDRQFVKNIMMKNKKMLPAWWSEALVKSGAPRERGIR